MIVQFKPERCDKLQQAGEVMKGNGKIFKGFTGILQLSNVLDLILLYCLLHISIIKLHAVEIALNQV